MTVAALVLGAVVAVVVALVTRGASGERDASMDWEARFAGMMAAVLFAGPIWLAQLVVTIIAAATGSSMWLWAWWIGAPLLGGLAAPSSRKHPD